MNGIDKKERLLQIALWESGIFVKILKILAGREEYHEIIRNEN